MSANSFAVLSWALPLVQGFTRSGTARPAHPRAQTPAPGSVRPGGLGTILRSAWRRHRTRQCLAGMNAYLLKDIGISYAEAEAEANKPFWVA